MGINSTKSSDYVSQRGDKYKIEPARRVPERPSVLEGLPLPPELMLPCFHRPVDSYYTLDGQFHDAVKRLKCKNCMHVLPPSDFDAAMRRNTHAPMTCWSCQHPKCSRDGCEERQTIARVGKYTCEKCMYPPCHVCENTPRPRGGGKTKYKVHSMPEWICSKCWEASRHVPHATRTSRRT